MSRKYAQVKWIAHEPASIYWYERNSIPYIQIECSCGIIKKGKQEETWTKFTRHTSRENFRVARQAMIKNRETND